jgi:hypothetical protein
VRCQGAEVPGNYVGKHGYPNVSSLHGHKGPAGIMGPMFEAAGPLGGASSDASAPVEEES